MKSSSVIRNLATVGTSNKLHISRYWGYKNVPSFMHDFQNKIVPNHLPQLLFNKFNTYDSYYGILTPTFLQYLQDNQILDKIYYTRNQHKHLLGRLELNNFNSIKICSEYIFHFELSQILHNFNIKSNIFYQINYPMLVSSSILDNIPQLSNIIKYPRTYYLDGCIQLSNNKLLLLEFNEYQSHNSKKTQLNDYIKQNELATCDYVEDIITIQDKINYMDIKFLNNQQYNNQIILPANSHISNIPEYIANIINKIY